MPTSLAGKCALITGAGSGIGRAMADRFLAAGAQVAVIARSEYNLSQWRSVDGALPIQADITKAEDVNRMIDVTQRVFGKIDIVCNVAGINGLSYPLHETDDERWDRIIDLDLKAPFRICRRVLPGMIARRSGVILNIGTAAAGRGSHSASYTAAKEGLIGMSRSIAVYYARMGIRCNVINPGAVNTQIGEHSGNGRHAGGMELLMNIIGKLPIKFMCEPIEIARAAVFLCSDDAAHINGSVVAVDGGMSAC